MAKDVAFLIIPSYAFPLARCHDAARLSPATNPGFTRARNARYHHRNESAGAHVGRRRAFCGSAQGAKYPGDSWWDIADHTDTPPQISAPVLMVAGFYDIFSPYQLRDYAAMVAAGKTPYLTIDPWSHTTAGVSHAFARRYFAESGKRRVRQSQIGSSLRCFDVHDPTARTPPDVIGPLTAQLFVKSSGQHTDFFKHLCDVDPSRRSTNLSDGIFHIFPSHPEVRPDGTWELNIEMWATAYRFKKGHSIRLQVSSGAHPRFVRNTGTGEPLAKAKKLKPINPFFTIWTILPQSWFASLAF